MKFSSHISFYRDRLLTFPLTSVVVCDQVSKYLISVNLNLYESWPETGLFRLTHGTNSGAAFGFFPDQTVLLTIISLFAIVFLYYFYRSQALNSKLMRFSIGLQLGGAFGNLIDRIHYGAVIDFIDVGWWPAFNIADSSIVIGVILLLFSLLIQKRINPEEDIRTEA